MDDNYERFKMDDVADLQFKHYSNENKILEYFYNLNLSVIHTKLQIILNRHDSIWMMLTW